MTFFTMDPSTPNTMGCTQEGYSKVSQYLINTGKPNTDILLNTFQKYHHRQPEQTCIKFKKWWLPGDCIECFLYSATCCKL